MELFKKIVKLKKQLNQALQFNRKIELKREYDNFLKENGITVRFNDPFCYYYKDDKEIAVIGERYAKRKINLCYKQIGNFLEIRETGQIINF